MQNVSNFDLHISKTIDGEVREVLIIPDSKMLYRQVELNFMGITNGFLQSVAMVHQIPRHSDDCADEGRYFNKVLNELISCCYINISEQIMEYAAEQDAVFLPSLFEIPLPFEGFIGLDIPIKEMIIKDHPLDSFKNELEVLSLALGRWLLYSPKIKMRPSERYCWAYQLMSSAKDLPQPVSNRTLPAFLSRIGQPLKGKERRLYMELAILYGVKHLREGTLKQSLTGMGIDKTIRRTREDYYTGEITAEIVLKTVLSRSYISRSGLIPLAWAEILYCVENDLVIRQCTECAYFFHVKGNGNGKYCSEVCKQKAKKKQNDKYYTQKKQTREMAQQGKPLEEIIQHVRNDIPYCRAETIEKWVTEGLCEIRRPECI